MPASWMVDAGPPGETPGAGELGRLPVEEGVEVVLANKPTAADANDLHGELLHEGKAPGRLDVDSEKVSRLDQRVEPLLQLYNGFRSCRFNARQGASSWLRSGWH